jgi:hypothetical protein
MDDLDLHVVANQSTKNGVQKHTEFTATSASMQPPPPLRWRLWVSLAVWLLLDALVGFFGDRFNGDSEVENAARRRWTMPQTPREEVDETSKPDHTHFASAHCKPWPPVVGWAGEQRPGVVAGVEQPRSSRSFEVTRLRRVTARRPGWPRGPLRLTHYCSTAFA